ncbi:MAG: VanZ family protein [Prevotellaceae bacterium]|nr:VanZ family protein [Prevotellaceae bacterium]
MKINSHLIKKYPISCVCIAIIWYLCFFTPPHTKLDNVAFIDKWVHISMYCGTCSVIWYEYLRQHKTLNRLRLFLLAWLAPVLMSGLIELLQAYCTGGRRSGDWLDFAANSTGATLAVVIGLVLSRYVKCKGKD